MKVLAVLLTLIWALAASATAQSALSMLAALPTCAQPCTLSALTAGNCLPANPLAANLTEVVACSCTNVTLSKELSTCVQAKCGWEAQLNASSVFQSQCASFPHESRRGEVYATAISCLALSLLFVGLRCLARFVVTSKLWWDDWTTLMATAFLAAICGSFIEATKLGFGLHLWDVLPTNVPTILKLFYGTQILYILIQVSAKVSILILYGRIFPARWFRITVWSCVVFLIGHGSIFVALVVFQCNPIARAWDRSITDFQCINITAVGWAGGAFAIFEDIVILLLPIPEVMKLQLTIQKKIAVFLMFAIGSFACVTSMLRLRHLDGFGNSLDATWDNADTVIYSIMELSVAIICASLPALRPLLVKVPGFFSTANQSIQSGKNQSSSAGTRAGTAGAATVGSSNFSTKPPPSAYARSRGFTDLSDDSTNDGPFTSHHYHRNKGDDTEMAVFEKGRAV